MEAERETAKLYAALFMQNRTGEEFDGIISHVAKFGFFVELADFFVEGLIHVNSLEDDRYQYDENGILLRGRRTKRAFRVGDRVRVGVEDVDMVAGANCRSSGHSWGERAPKCGLSPRCRKGVGGSAP